MNQRIITPSTQQGMTLIMLVLIVGLAATAFILNVLNANTVKIERDKKTAAALAEAKAALIGWSASNPNMPGALPCPDTANTGVSGACGASSGIIGRFPWKTLGSGDLRDGSGECLWYVLSPIYRNTIAAGSRISNPINSNVPGTVTVERADGTPLVNPVLAVIIAPGPALAGQDRSSAVTSVCGGNSMASNYLDTALGINNATGNVSGSNYTFISGVASGSFNDRLVYITANEFYRTVRQRIVKEILGNVAIPAGPAKYYSTNTSYPCPASTPAGSSDCPSLPLSHYINNSGMVPPLQYASLGTWLANNGWFTIANYTYTDANHVGLNMADGLGSYTCNANANVFTCTSP